MSFDLATVHKISMLVSHDRSLTCSGMGCHKLSNTSTMLSDTSGYIWVLLVIESTNSFHLILLWWDSAIFAFYLSIRSCFISQFDYFTTKNMETMTESSRHIAKLFAVQWSKLNTAINSTMKTTNWSTSRINARIKLMFSFKLFKKMRQRLSMALDLTIWQNIGNSGKMIFNHLRWRAEENVIARNSCHTTFT